jgi:hypothetical protein
VNLLYVEPGQREASEHRRKTAKEIYVVLDDDGRVKLDDEPVELARLDAVRVARAPPARSKPAPTGCRCCSSARASSPTAYGQRLLERVGALEHRRRATRFGIKRVVPILWICVPLWPRPTGRRPSTAPDLGTSEPQCKHGGPNSAVA